MSSKSIAVFGLIGLSLMGCKETTSSENIRTRGIAMITEVTAHTDSRARVRTELRVGGDESNTFVILEGGDELVVDADGEEQVMEAVSDGIYETAFSSIGGGTEFTVRLERDGDDDAPGNHGVLPEPFEITSEFDMPVSRGEDSMEVTWEPSGEGDDMDIRFSDMADDSCIFDLDDDIPGDPGTYLLEPDTLDSTSSSDPETCDVQIEIFRTRDGSNDDALDGESSFVLQQIRETTFVSAP